MTITITSIGWLHEPPPGADVYVDVRNHLNDPAASATLRKRGLLDRTGLDSDVRSIVLGTPGAVRIVAALAGAAMAGRAHHIVIGCAGGKHRAVVLAEAVAAVLRIFLPDVVVQHRDIDRPRVLRGPDEERPVAATWSCSECGVPLSTAHHRTCPTCPPVAPRARRTA